MSKLKVFRAADFFERDFRFALMRAVHTPKELPPEERYRREFWKITCILRGKGQILVDETPYPVHAGSLFFVHPAAETTFTFETKELELYNILFDPALLGEELEILRGSFQFFDIFSDSFRQKDHFTLYLLDSTPKLRALIREMKHEYTVRPANYRLVLRAGLLKLLVLMQRGSEMKVHRTGRERTAEYITFLLKRNYASKITLRALAEKAGLTPNHLCFLYRKQTGQSIISALNAIRLEHAASMLKESDARISRISLECGFGDLSYFYRLFARYYGSSPGEYRKKYG